MIQNYKLSKTEKQTEVMTCLVISKFLKALDVVNPPKPKSHGAYLDGAV